jgi:hypothetical protein
MPKNKVKIEKLCAKLSKTKFPSQEEAEAAGQLFTTKNFTLRTPFKWESYYSQLKFQKDSFSRELAEKLSFYYLFFCIITSGVLVTAVIFQNFLYSVWISLT